MAALIKAVSTIAVNSVARFVENPNLGNLRYLSDAGAPLRDYGSYKLRSFRRQSKLGVDPYGQKYRPLSPWYAKFKRAKYGNQPILTATGRMVSSHRVRVTGRKFTESLDDPALKHQIGFEVAKRPPMPDQRGLPEGDRQALWNAVVANARRAFR